jgi:2-keto-4-pentenoate hydratase/2-oxohepta-3-ene-1,7-dioic acid hydratase in catechol pathway
MALPIDRPSKIVCVGLNYRDHAEEQGVDLPEAPLLFAKWPNALIGPGELIILPAAAREVDYEAELGVVIGTAAKHVEVDGALDHVRGYIPTKRRERAQPAVSPTSSGRAASRRTPSAW